ncbi:hypothetical protein KP509_28G006900 [Ceratopteris richardii]|uniref:Copia protein n=1 Tax=Ceratopteris richardii TaxID=49495 RepID=A0A8T2R9A4_CERRI|nr:hypothetical protein KP509_28G006900 [Ceratopteris richardii]
MHNPWPLHVMYLKRLLHYLKHTSDLSLTYKYNPSNFCLLGYSHADWGGDPSTFQSTSGYLFLLADGAVSWQSKKQTRVTLSFTEAEYSSMTLAIKEGICLNTFLKGSTLLIPPPISLYCDNQSAILLAQNVKHSEKTKNIAIKLQFIRELVQEGSIKLIHVQTEQEWADFLTKSVPKAKHLESCTHTGLRSLQSSSSI